MPIKPEVALEFFGIDPEKFENDDAFRETAAKEWTKSAEAIKDPNVMSAVTGRMNGVIAGALKKSFKALELPTEGIDFDKTPPAEIVVVLAETAKKTFTEREGKLTESLKGKGTEEAKKEYERQLAELSKKAQEYESVNSSLRGEIEGIKKAETEREAQRRVSTEWEQAELVALKDIKFKNELEKKGFEAAARERFKVTFDEKGEPYWVGKDGKRIQDGSKHQAFKGGSELLKDLAAELKVGDVNPRGGELVKVRVGEAPPVRHADMSQGIRRIARPNTVLSDRA